MALVGQWGEVGSWFNTSNPTSQPVITLPYYKEIILVGSTYTPPLGVVNDLEDGILSVSPDNSVNVQQVGEQVLKYNYLDTSNVLAEEVELKVFVVSDINPRIGDYTLSYLDGLNKVIPEYDNEVILELSCVNSFSEIGFNNFDKLVINIGNESYDSSTDVDKLFILDGDKLQLQISDITELDAGNYTPELIGYNTRYNDGLLINGERLNKLKHPIHVLR